MKFNEEGEAICELIADPKAKHKPCLLNQTCQVFSWKKISSAWIIHRMKAKSVRRKKQEKKWKHYLAPVPQLLIRHDLSGHKWEECFTTLSHRQTFIWYLSYPDVPSAR